MGNLVESLGSPLHAGKIDNFLYTKKLITQIVCCHSVATDRFLLLFIIIFIFSLTT